VLNQYGDAATPYGFTGEWTDQTGLVHLRARYYESTLGRFITKDQLSGLAHYPQTINRYSYVTNNPVIFLDPTGNIGIKEAPEVNRLIERMKGYYGIRIGRDWGWEFLPSIAPSLGEFGCRYEWDEGLWTISELKMVQFALVKMADKMGGQSRFRKHMGQWNIYMKTKTCGKGCTKQLFRRIELWDH